MSCKHIPYRNGNACTSSDFKKMVKDKPNYVFYAQCGVCGEKIASPKSVTIVNLILNVIGITALTAAFILECALSYAQYGGWMVLLLVLGAGCLVASYFITAKLLTKGTWRSLAHYRNELRREEKFSKIFVYIIYFLWIVFLLVIIVTSVLDPFPN